MQTVGQWLQGLGLGQYTEVFERNAVDLELLCELSETDLERLGVQALGHRKRLLKAMSELERTQRPTQPQTSGSAVPEAERRQLTVMFCDLVGSTELATQLDPEQLRDLMQAYQRACGEVMTRYEGHIAQYLGDGLMVYFGWPRAHEDDAVRAIRAGLEVAETVSKLTTSIPISARVGIHTGLVVVGDTGQGDASVPKAAVGETPNIAARLQGLAQPGTVVVSARTRALAGGLFDYADLGSPALKGVSEPLHLFRVGGTRAVDSRFEAARSDTTLTPLVGREEEISLLLRRWEEAQEGDGQVVLVGGEPGIGKSRLTRALRERLQQKRYTVLRYQCSPYHINSALYPIIDQFERAAAFARDDTEDEKLDKLEAVLAGGEALVAESAPLLAAMVSLPVDRYPPLTLSPQKQKEKTLEALALQVEALARQQPVLMIYEDVHWIDATSQEGLDLLVPRLQGLPVLLIVTYRPEYSPRWSEQAHVTLMSLNRLGRRQGAELLTKLTDGKALPREVQEQILAHTDGVPLFVEELTKSILESKLLRDTGDRYVLDGPLPALAIPTTLRDSLIARLDRLAPIREIAQIGACIGREFGYDILAAISPLRGQRLDDALDQLTTSGLLFRRGTPPDALYTFKHALVQDAAYDSLLRSRRAQLHAEIARTLETDFADRVANEPEVLAYHFTEAGLNKRAVAYWLAAAHSASGRFSNSEAVGHAQSGLKALAALEHGDERDQQELPLQMTLGWALASDKGYGAAEVWPPLSRAHEICNRSGQTARMGSILFGLWVSYLMRGHYQTAKETAKQILELGQQLDNSGLTVVGDQAVACIDIFTADFRSALKHAEAGLAAYDVKEHAVLAQERGGFDNGPFCADWCTWAYWLLGYPDRSQRLGQQAMDMAKSAGLPFTTASILVHSAIIWYFRRSPETVLQQTRSAIALCDQVGIPLRKTEAKILQGWALVELGETAAGIQELETGLSIWMQMGTQIANSIWFALLALAYRRSGRIDDARTELSRAFET